MNVNLYIIEDYEIFIPLAGQKNKPNSNPICILSGAAVFFPAASLSCSQARNNCTRQSSADRVLGSEYYAVNPIYPLAKTLGVINMDSLNVHGKTSDVVIVGLGNSDLVGNSDLDDFATQVAADQGRVIKPDPTPEKGSFYRSDHFPFAQQGVPALSSRDGIDYVGKPEGYGMQIIKEYISKHYHKPSDIIRPDWDTSGAVQQLQYYWMVGYRVAEADKYPEWKPGTEFKTKREASLEAVGIRSPQ